MNFKQFLLEQNFDSYDTALRGNIPETYKQRGFKFDFNDYDILDYGCGYGKGKEFLESHYNCVVYNYDPDTRRGFLNGVEEFCASNNPQKIICCNNVLNVIDGSLNEILHKISRIANMNDVELVVFKIYEGDGSGIGRQTGKKKWQRNEKTSTYVPAVKQFFTKWDVNQIGKSEFIVCKQIP